MRCLSFFLKRAKKWKQWLRETGRVWTLIWVSCRFEVILIPAQLQTAVWISCVHLFIFFWIWVECDEWRQRKGSAVKTQCHKPQLVFKWRVEGYQDEARCFKLKCGLVIKKKNWVRIIHFITCLYMLGTVGFMITPSLATPVQATQQEELIGSCYAVYPVSLLDSKHIFSKLTCGCVIHLPVHSDAGTIAHTHTHICTLQILIASFHWLFFFFFLHAHIMENPPCIAARDVTHGCFVCVSHMKISPQRSIFSHPQQPGVGLPVSKAGLLILCTVESWSFFSFCSRCCFLR